MALARQRGGADEGQLRLRSRERPPLRPRERDVRRQRLPRRYSHGGPKLTTPEATDTVRAPGPREVLRAPPAPPAPSRPPAPGAASPAAAPSRRDRVLP